MVISMEHSILSRSSRLTIKRLQATNMVRVVKWMLLVDNAA